MREEEFLTDKEVSEYRRYFRAFMFKNYKFINEDIIQDTFYNINKHKDTFDSYKASKKTWSISILKQNIALHFQELKRNKKRGWFKLELPEYSSIEDIADVSDKEDIKEEFYDNRNIFLKELLVLFNMNNGYIHLKESTINKRSYNEISKLYDIPLFKVKELIFIQRLSIKDSYDIFTKTGEIQFEDPEIFYSKRYKKYKKIIMTKCINCENEIQKFAGKKYCGRDCQKKYNLGKYNLYQEKYREMKKVNKKV